MEMTHLDEPLVVAELLQLDLEDLRTDLHLFFPGKVEGIDLFELRVEGSEECPLRSGQLFKKKMEGEGGEWIGWVGWVTTADYLNVNEQQGEGENERTAAGGGPALLEAGD